jgi:vitamin B12 transporter
VKPPSLCREHHQPARTGIDEGFYPMKHLQAALLAATAWPAAAQAQRVTNTDQTPIVVTATRVATPVNQVPASVTVLTQKDFIAQGDTTLAQALSTVPGVNMVQSGGPGNAASLFIRGTNSEDVLVLLDGVPVNDPANPNGAFNFGIVNLADVERIEIIRGPMSGLYGTSAIGGVVNIITKRGTAVPEATASVAGGYPAQGQGDASISGMSGKFDYALSGAVDQEAGFDATPRRMSVYANNPDPYRAWLGSAQFGYAVTPLTRIYIIGRGQATDAAFPNLSDPIFDDPNEFDYNTSGFGKLGISSAFLDGRLTTDLFVARLQTRLFNKNLLDANDPNQASADDTYEGGRTDTQWNNTLRLDDTRDFAFSNVTFGAEYTNDTADETVNEGGLYGPFTETVHGAQHNWAGHVGVQTTIMDRLTATAALREDNVSSFGNAVTWRLGGNLALPEIDASLKASVGTGFLAPSLFDLYYVDNYGDSGNPNLKPEYSTGWECGPTFVLPMFGQADGFDVTATYFGSSIRDLIQAEETPDFTYVEENVAQANIHGVETIYIFHPASWLSANLNYTYTHAVSGPGGPPLLRRPENAGSASLTITPTARLTIAPQVQYIGRFEDYLYDNNGYPAGIGSSDPGTIVNLNISYQLNQKFTLFASGKNILNSQFEAVNGLQIPGASFVIGIRASME